MSILFLMTRLEQHSQGCDLSYLNLSLEAKFKYLAQNFFFFIFVSQKMRQVIRPTIDHRKKKEKKDS